MTCPPPGDLPNPGIKPRSSALQEDSLRAEPPGKPMNSGVGSLSLLQEIFLTQELNRGLLHDQASFSYSKGHRPSEILLTNAGTRKNLILLDPFLNSSPGLCLSNFLSPIPDQVFQLLSQSPAPQLSLCVFSFAPHSCSRPLKNSFTLHFSSRPLKSNICPNLDLNPIGFPGGSDGKESA